jgi:hypothetical protein
MPTDVAGTAAVAVRWVLRGAIREGEIVMRKSLVPLAAAVALGLTPAAAFAAGTVTGAAGGAVTGAIVGGPVGAVVGGTIGAIVGTAVDPPPPEVVTYVETQQPPPVMLQGDLVVGATLPESVVLYPVPADVYVSADGWAYEYAYVNGHRVVVDPRTRAIVAIAAG